MFALMAVEDTIRLDPNTFSLPHETALQQEINDKFANKVLGNVGVCVCLYDIESSSDGLLTAGDGAMYIKTKFRLIVFAPFVGEVLVGWISSCTSEGLHVRMGFFDDVFIPKSMLFEGSQYIKDENAWLWKQDEYELYLDLNEKIRFRVEQSNFEKDGLKIVGSCQVDGMGLLSWW